MTSVALRSGKPLEPKPTITVAQIADTPAAPGFGVHLTLDGYGGCQHRLSDANRIMAVLSKLPEHLGMHKLMEPSVMELGQLSPKDPGGISGFVMIAESHISIHTFPLRGFITADVYTCQNTLDTEEICNYFADAFGLEDLEINLVRRGTRYPQRDIYPSAQKVA